jgi:hypothetical protein
MLKNLPAGLSIDGVQSKLQSVEFRQEALSLYVFKARTE